MTSREERLRKRLPPALRGVRIHSRLIPPGVGSGSAFRADRQGLDRVWRYFQSDGNSLPILAKLPCTGAKCLRSSLYRIMLEFDGRRSSVPYDQVDHERECVACCLCDAGRRLRSGKRLPLARGERRSM